MLLPEAIIRAAGRWIVLLRTSTFSQAWGIIRSDRKYTDLTQTQYFAALDWLKSQNFLLPAADGFSLYARYRNISLAKANELLFERILEASELPWLPDADKLIPDVGELPQDAANVSTVLDVPSEAAFLAVRRVHGRVDLARRALIGATGEKALFSLLEVGWPGSATHVSENSDGYGYDLAFFLGNEEWHLEVKSTLRRGRLIVYLSRNEFEVGISDPSWRLILVGLNQELQINLVATVRFQNLICRAPMDVSRESKWQSASFELTSADLTNGLDFLDNRAGHHPFPSPLRMLFP